MPDTDPPTEPEPAEHAARSEARKARARAALGQPVEEVAGWFDDAEVGTPTADRKAVRTRLTGEPEALVAGENDTTQRALVLAACLASAASAAFAPAEPTGFAVLDIVLRAGFGFALAFMASRSRRWTWIAGAAIAAAASHHLLGGVAAWAALIVAVGAVYFDVRPRWVGAVIGALVTTALFRLESVGPHGMSVVIGAAASIPVFVSGYRLLRQPLRRRVRTAALVVVGIGAVALVVFGVSAYVGATHVDHGIAEARAGLASAKDGEQGATTEHFNRATQEFADANAVFTSWYVAPVRAVPLMNYQVQAVGGMSTVGRDLGSIAGDAAQRADYHNIAVVDGQIDIDKIKSFGGPLADIDLALRRAQFSTDSIQTEWLAPPLQSQYDNLDTQVRDALDETTTAIAAVNVAPDMLGANGARRYFVAFTTPAESRGLGGFMGNWAELTADHGRLELARTGRDTDLFPVAGDPPRVLDAPSDYVDRYGQLHPETQVRDVTLSPDFPSVAQAIASIYPQTRGGSPIDGALALDPTALASMLKITGPITVKGLDTPLTSGNAADVLLKQQYVDFDKKKDRVDFLDEAARKTFDTLIHQKKLRPGPLANALGPSVDEGRVLAYSKYPEEEVLINRLHMGGQFPVERDGDFLALVTQNAGNNKMDVFLHREIRYDVRYDAASGTIEANVTIVLHNDAPTSGLPDIVLKNRDDSHQPRGTNWLWFNFYSPHDLVSSTLDGRALEVGGQHEFGLHVYQAYLPVPSGGGRHDRAPFERHDHAIEHLPPELAQPAAGQRRHAPRRRRTRRPMERRRPAHGSTERA